MVLAAESRKLFELSGTLLFVLLINCFTPMPPLELSTSDDDLTTHEPHNCYKVRQSKSMNNSIQHNFDLYDGISDLDQLRTSSYDSDGLPRKIETYSDDGISHHHGENKKWINIHVDPSYWNKNNLKLIDFCTEKDTKNNVIWKTNCYPQSQRLVRIDECHTENCKIRSPRRVNFSSEIEKVIDIPSHRSLDPQVKQEMYISLRIIQAEAIRNRKEWDYELHNIHNVVEESEFIPDCNGKLWHPVHWNPII